MGDAIGSTLRTACVLAAVIAPTTASAFGFPGCPDLPEYNRALGTLQGMTTCGLTVEEARRIVAAHDGPSAVPQPIAPVQPTYHPRYRQPR